MKNAIKFLSFACIGIAMSYHAISQSKVGIGTTEPNPFAVLTLVSESGNQGLLVPQLANDQMLALQDTLGAAENGLIIYNTDISEFFYWDNSQGIWHMGLGAMPDDFIAGDGIAVSNAIITNTGDLDTLNEIQDLELIGDSLFITGKEFARAIDLNRYYDNTDEQNLRQVLERGANAGGLAITNIAEPVAPADAATKFYVDTQFVPDPDPDPENEIQDLQIANDILTITMNPDATDIDLSVYDVTDTLPLSAIMSKGNSAGSRAITNVLDPTNAQDVATKAYVDGQDTVYTLAKILTASTDAGANRITNLTDPTAAADAATKGYVDGINIDDVLGAGSDAQTDSIVNLGAIVINGTSPTAGTRLDVTGATRIDGALDATGATTIGGTLDVTGNGQFLANVDIDGDLNVDGTFTNPSDIRFKQDIHPLENALSNLLKMEGVRYLFRVDEFPDRKFSQEVQIGFIAQQLEDIYPEFVITRGDGYKGVNYAQITAVLVEGMKEQQQMIQSQAEEIARLKAQLGEMASLKANVDWLMQQFAPKTTIKKQAEEER